MTFVRFLGLFALLTTLTACLPEDTRTPPGRLLVTASADPELAAGFMTADGWEIAYERFWLSLGNVRIEARGCDNYSEAYYLRLLDMRRPGAQTVATMHGLGRCEFGFQLRSPAADAVLGAGLTDDAKAFMRRAGSDAFVQSSGSVLHVAGTATKSAMVVRFSWSFRQSVDYLCELISLERDHQQTVDIRVVSTTLFQDRLDDASAELRFDAHAAADGDADGEITLDELAVVPVSGGGTSETLGSRLYLELLPKLLRREACFIGKLDGEP